jgi:hypothetical protein
MFPSRSLGIRMNFQSLSQYHDVIPAKAGIQMIIENSRTCFVDG